MGKKLNLIVYIRDKERFYLSTGEKKISSVFENHQDISSFFEENHVTHVTVIFGRPAIFIRKIEFPFSSLKMISQVILEETSPLFPVSTEELELFWYPVLKEKTKTIVSILGIEKSKIEKWQKLSATHKFKLNICFEPFILSNYVSKITTERNFILVFIDHNYFARYIVKNKMVVESNSSYIEPDTIENVLADVVNNNDERLPVFCITDSKFSARTDQYTLLIPPVSESVSSVLFSIFESKKNLYKPSHRVFSVSRSELAVNPFVLLAVICYLIIAGLMFRPLLIARQIQEKVNDTDKKMEQIFREAFPDVKKIVNPVIQARERLRNIGDVQKVVPKISVISIMKEISDIVPANFPFKVSQMSLRGSDLFLTCSTDTLENVELLTQKFTRSSIFQNVKVGSIVPESGQITFNLLMKVKYEKN